MTDRINTLKGFLQDKPEDNFLLHALALEYIKLGHDHEARELFEALLERDPAYTGSYYHLAKLHERTGDREKAVAVYERGMAACKQAGDNHAFNELQAAYEELVSE